ncbi:MAG: flagellar protein FlaG [Halobacteria archaeon]|nr:flagellar protein FlaG [Halobacteria archaeon]
MNDSISQLLPLVDTRFASRQGERPGQNRRAVSAVAETHRSRGRHSASGTHENNTDDANKLSETVAELNSKLQQMQRGLRFSVDDSSGRIVVKVIDLDTDEIIRQIPSEEMLTIMQQVGDSQSMIFNDEA